MKVLSVEDKVNIILHVDNRGTKRKTEIAKEWGIPASSLSTIMKNKARLLELYCHQSFSPTRKRMRTAALPDVDAGLIKWLKDVRKSNLSINGPMLKQRACDIAKELGHQDFACSNGWLERFKNRHGITFCGDGGEVTIHDYSVSSWNA